MSDAEWPAATSRAETLPVENAGGLGAAQARGPRVEKAALDGLPSAAALTGVRGRPASSSPSRVLCCF